MTTSAQLPPAPHVLQGLEIVYDFYRGQSQLLQGPTGWQILDMGCGEGRHVQHLGGLGHNVVGFDNDAQAIHRAQAASHELVKSGKIRYELGNKLDGVFDEPMFDGVLCNEMLHMLDPVKRQHLVRKMMSITKRGGFILSSAYIGPIANGTRLRPLLPGTLRRAYDEKGWIVIDDYNEPYSETKIKTGFVVNSIARVIAVKP